MSELPNTKSYLPLGKTDMRISRLGLGTWGLSGPKMGKGYGAQDDSVSVATIRRALDVGINWLDTAPVYGHGHAEEVICLALKDIPRSQRPLIFTKTGYWWDETDHYKPAVPRINAAMVVREIEESLKRLGVDHVDVLQAHAEPQDGHDVEEYWEAMEKVRKDGKARAIGLCNHRVEKVARADAISHVNLLQVQFSALRRHTAVDQIPWALGNGASVIAWGPLYSGLLSGAYDREGIGRFASNDFRSRDPEFNENLDANQRIVATLRDVARARGSSVASVAVGWVLSWPGITGAIVGARAPQELDEQVGSHAEPLTPEEVDTISNAIRVNQIGTGPAAP